VAVIKICQDKISIVAVRIKIRIYFDIESPSPSAVFVGALEINPTLKASSILTRPRQACDRKLYSALAPDGIL
jgi:hypothetical protein